MNTNNTNNMVARKVQGFCGYCGAAKWVPTHPAGAIRPRAEVVCGHTSD